MKSQINHNIFWAETTVKLLEFLGVKNVVISPGSRSTPFVFAFSKSKKINKTVVIDERDNGFFALGLAKASRVPAAIVTTSGTATAELYPAIIEAYNSRTPLIVITSDRPEYLYGTGANQTINQINLYKNHIRKFFDFDAEKPTKRKIAELKKEIADAFEIAAKKNPGPVHLNFHFEKPFEPDDYTTAISEELLTHAFSNVSEKSNKAEQKNRTFASLAKKIADSEKGIIITGNGFYSKKDIQGILNFSAAAKYPIFADGLSPFRFLSRAKKNVFVNQTAFLKSRKVKPEIIFQFGSAPTANVLLSFFKESEAEKYVVNPFGDLNDPSRTADKTIREEYSSFAASIVDNLKSLNFKRVKSAWFNESLEFENISESLKKKIIEKAPFWFEGNIIIELMKNIPAGSNLFISNSLPARDVDFFAPKSGKDVSVFSNRGASGIDGVTATAFGTAAATKRRTFLLTGDLAFFHDANALWIAKNYNLPVTIILVDNSGGGIFNLLPVADYPSVFRDYFLTSTGADFGKIVKAYGLPFYHVKNRKEFPEKLNSAVKESGTNVLRVKTNSFESKAIRKKYWDAVKDALARL